MSNALEKRQPVSVSANGDENQSGHMRMIELAIEKNAPIDTIERLVALSERMQARQAEAAFNAAMNRVQSVMGPVTADLNNPQTKSRYASYKALDERIRPVYAKEGFSLSFDTQPTDKPDTVLVLCYVSHSEGHTRTYRREMPADGKGAKGGDVMTKTHASAAAQSYAMRYLLKGIFNIAISEDDNDGNGASASRFSDLDERLHWIKDARTWADVDKHFRQAYAEANKLGDTHAMKALIAAKDARRRELA